MLILMLNESEFGSQALCTVCDADILNIAKEEPDAVHKLYEKTHKTLYGYILSITKNTHDTEDALQETYLAIYRSASKYRPHGKPMAWIFTVAKNAANMQLRNRAAHISAECAYCESLGVKESLIILSCLSVERVGRESARGSVDLNAV